MLRKHTILTLLGLFLFVLAGCTALSGLTGDVTAESSETQGIDVAGVPSLTVTHFGGEIHVTNGEDGRVEADLTKYSHLENEAEAQAQLGQIVMSFSQRGTDVTLNVEGPEGIGDLTSVPSAGLELRVPPGTMLVIDLGAGEVTVDQPTGDVTIDSGAGEATVILPADASFHLVVGGGVAEIVSDFEGVPTGGVAADVDVVIGDNPTQTLTFNMGAGAVHLEQAP